MNLQILPLAITMMAGPQMMSAIIFVTASKPLKLSAFFLRGVVIAVTAGVSAHRRYQAKQRKRGPNDRTR